MLIPTIIKFYSRGKADSDNPISAQLTCSDQYQIGERVKCKFDVTNKQNMDYYLLKWNTPLEGMKTACFSVSREGRAINYDGMLIRRGHASAQNYILLKAGNTVSAMVDLSLAYAMNATGKYTVQFKSNLQYCPTSGSLPCPQGEDNQVRKMRDLPSQLRSMSVQEATSTSATFQLIGSGMAPKTLGENYRQLSKVNQQVYSQQAGTPRDPVFVGGSAADHALTKEIHRANYHYVSAANSDIDDNQAHYVSWFGSADANRISQVKQKFNEMKSSLEQDTYTYHFDDPGCSPGVYAFTYFDSTDIFLCDVYTASDNLVGIDTKLCTIVHELSHAKSGTEDIIYGRKCCLHLAISSPDLAINNGDNYCYFLETMNLFDYGFDSIARLPNGKTYVTKGNVYIRYSDSSASTIDSGYPACIKENWGALPDIFVQGFDSMSTLRNGKTYITKGGQFVRYSDSSASTVDSGYPLPIQGLWGATPSTFNDGFDAMAVLPNGKLYVFKGNQYIRYSDSSGSTVDSGYPRQLQSNWGSLNADFAAGFDSIAALGNGKTYATKGKKYIRYSDSWASQVDSGYPLPIRRNWGVINFPGPQ